MSTELEIDQDKMVEDKLAEETVAPSSGGFLQFYGLYWKREFVFSIHATLPGVPTGWIGRGTKNIDRQTVWMNFWDQKGVYVLYDRDLTPVYTGQAGVSRKGGDGGTIGNRLNDHLKRKYRNGWEYFSWFGFLSSGKEKKLRKKLKSADLEDRKDPDWCFHERSGGDELNSLLNAFEAILIEAFVPRFNSRGGNLKDAIYVDQMEMKPRFIDQA